ncbi:MAG: aminopeptidase, partial [Chloroflexi bacterium]|nr:aminopeptidase [Chloroflexota bacterium]
MYDNLAPRLAQVLTEYSVPVKPGDLAVITGLTTAEPLMVALFEALVRRGAHPSVRATFPILNEIMLELGSDEQLAYQNPVPLAMAENMDAFFMIAAPINTRQLATADPARLVLGQKSREKWWEAYRVRRDAGQVAWNV